LLWVRFDLLILILLLVHVVTRQWRLRFPSHFFRLFRPPKWHTTRNRLDMHIDTAHSYSLIYSMDIDTMIIIPKLLCHRVSYSFHCIC
jgi:hypothetical protein